MYHEGGVVCAGEVIGSRERIWDFGPVVVVGVLDYGSGGCRTVHAALHTNTAPCVSIGSVVVVELPEVARIKVVAEIETPFKDPSVINAPEVANMNCPCSVERASYKR